jgi:hypothetical protein
MAYLLCQYMEALVAPEVVVGNKEALVDMVKDHS